MDGFCSILSRNEAGSNKRPLSFYFVLFSYLLFRHQGCDCAPGYDGPTCEIASASTLTLSDLAIVATSKNSVGWIVGIVIGVVLIGLGVVFWRDRVQKKKKKQQRMNGHFRASAEMT